MRFTQVCGRPVSCQNFEFWLFKCDCRPKLFGWWGVVLRSKGLNLIFLVGINVGETDFLFWVGVIRLEWDGLVCVMGLSRMGGLVGPFSMSSKLHVLGPLKWFGPIKGPDGLFKKLDVTLKRTKASVKLELGSVLGMD